MALTHTLNMLKRPLLLRDVFRVAALLFLTTEGLKPLMLVQGSLNLKVPLRGGPLIHPDTGGPKP